MTNKKLVIIGAGIAGLSAGCYLQMNRGLGNFYMCGQWADTGGLPMVLKSGRDVAQIICKRDGRDFKTV